MRTTCNHKSNFLNMLCLLKHDPHWWQANWSTEKEGMVCKGLSLSLSLQCHSLKIVFNVATSRDSCSWPLKLAPTPSMANRETHRMAGCSAGHPTGTSAGRLPWPPAGWPQEPNETATICHLVTVKVKELTHTANTDKWLQQSNQLPASVDEEDINQTTTDIRWVLAHKL